MGLLRFPVAIGLSVLMAATTACAEPAQAAPVTVAAAAAAEEEAVDLEPRREPRPSMPTFLDLAAIDANGVAASVRKEDISVRLSGIGEASFDVEVAAYVETVDATEFAKVREVLLVAIIDVVEHAGARLELPTREVMTAAVAVERAA